MIIESKKKERTWDKGRLSIAQATTYVTFAIQCNIFYAKNEDKGFKGRID